MDARKIYRFLIATTSCNIILSYLLIHRITLLVKVIILISFQQNVSESETFLIIELQNALNTFVTLNRDTVQGFLMQGIEKELRF